MDYVTIIDTNWIYPPNEVDVVLQQTTVPYHREGNVITCSTFNQIVQLLTDIYNYTTTTQPIGNVGYSLGVGTSLKDMGREVVWKLSSGETVLIWRLVKQMTPQEPYTVIPVPGNSPMGTIGYLTVFTSWANSNRPNIYVDGVLVARI